VPRRDDLVSEVRPLLQPGDMVVVLGAGNIHGVAEELVHGIIGTQSTWTVQ
jgi:UDP-N-acetylmuramate-alanine ligase